MTRLNSASPFVPLSPLSGPVAGKVNSVNATPVIRFGNSGPLNQDDDDDSFASNGNNAQIPKTTKFPAPTDPQVTNDPNQQTQPPEAEEVPPELSRRPGCGPLAVIGLTLTLAVAALGTYLYQYGPKFALTGSKPVVTEATPNNSPTLTVTQTPDPETTAEPTPDPTPEATPEPTKTPKPKPSPEPEEEETTPKETPKAKETPKKEEKSTKQTVGSFSVSKEDDGTVQVLKNNKPFAQVTSQGKVLDGDGNAVGRVDKDGKIYQDGKKRAYVQGGQIYLSTEKADGFSVKVGTALIDKEGDAWVIRYDDTKQAKRDGKTVITLGERKIFRLPGNLSKPQAAAIAFLLLNKK